MAVDTTLRFASVSELAELLDRGAVTAVELLETSLARLEEVRPLNAVATVLADRARQEARRADEARRRGERPPLCGIPYGVKDTFAAAGGPTTWGSAYFAGRTLARDATAVQRLCRSGGVLVAKLAMSELAGFGGPASPGASVHGPAKNPWDPRRYAGGSSGGSAIAVATGAVPFALGTETGGSVVGPATLCGVTGLRPTFGLVPRGGALTLSWSLDKVGVIAREARDCSLVLSALLGRADRSAETSAGRRGRRGGRGGPVDGGAVRVGFVPSELDECAPKAAEALAGGVEEFLRLFPRVVELDSADYGRCGPALNTLMLTEGAYSLRHELADPAFRLHDATQEANLRSGATTSAADYLDALTQADRTRRRFRRLFGRCDVLLSLSRTSTARPLGEPRNGTGSTPDRLRAAANLAGLPGVAFPCGLADDGLPVGLHLVGPRGSDAFLLDLAARYQEATDHHRRHPPG